MNFIFPVIELVDRLAIAEIKFYRTGANQEELAWYQEQILKINFDIVREEYQSLKQIHDKIWDLESELKSGKEDELSLDEIGRRAIEIRNWNRRRIDLKNQMAEKLGCAVKEIKRNHISQ